MSTDAQLALKICRYTEAMEKSPQTMYTILRNTLKENCIRNGFSIGLTDVFPETFTETIPNFRERLLKYVIQFEKMKVLLDLSL